MKLLRFKPKNHTEKYLGILFSDNQVVDVIQAIEQIFDISLDKSITMQELIMNEELFSKVQKISDELNQYQKNNPTVFNQFKKKIFYSLNKITLLPPILNPQKIICLGRNYEEHAKEGGKEPPKNPMIWGKFNSSIIGPNESIILPKISEKVDVEVELVIVMRKKGRYIPENEALDYIAGYMIGNDVSARDLQYTDKQYTRAKTIDTFTPIGPWIVTRDEIPNPQELSMELKVNQKSWQQSNTKHMIFSVPYIISYLSRSFTFEPGDLIFTGTPSGVGHYQKPPVYLKHGDTVSLSIDNIGTLTNPVIDEKKC
jgi:acylpyruvate hydrolase